MRNEEFIELFEIYRVLNKRFAQKWSKVSENGHSVAQALILEVLAKEGKQRATSLANSLSITSGGITGVVDKLVNEGLVKKSRDKRDRRAVYIEMTDRGTDLLGILRNQRIQLMQEFLSSLSEPELEELLKLNKKIYVN